MAAFPPCDTEATLALPSADSAPVAAESVLRDAPRQVSPTTVAVSAAFVSVSMGILWNKYRRF